MTNKAYIVANEQQEREVLIDLENQGYTWDNLVRSKPTVHVRKLFDGCDGFPYALFANENNHRIRWDKVELSNGLEIIYDGRKESKMKISKEVYDALMEWRDGNKNNLVQILCIRGNNLSNIPDVVSNWWLHDTLSNFESNQRLIAIIRWVNGEDVFEIEKPKKWIVRSKDTDIDGDYLYAILRHDDNLTDVMNRYDKSLATRFDTKEEAQEWCNSHQKVIEVEE